MAADRTPSPSSTGRAGRVRPGAPSTECVRPPGAVFIAEPPVGAVRPPGTCPAFFVPGHAADPEPVAVITSDAAHPVRTGSPAQAGGLQTGDRILAVDGNLVPDARVAVAAIRSRQPGPTVVLTLGRGSGRLCLSVRLGTGLPRSVPPLTARISRRRPEWRMRNRRTPSGRAPRAGGHTGLEGWAAVGERGGQARGDRRPRT
ncbi:PDZ domain-containing protein [Streptomyces murinus]|uniref:PDZ domain-containing protein n=1 Tax=Streptomyces murinus TaxID=33900 RepID=UPI000A1FF776